MKDLREAFFVLDIQILIDHSQGILRLSRENYIKKVLDRFGMKDSKLGDTPITKGDKFSLNQYPNNDLERNEMRKIPYASIVGSLMYLSDPKIQQWKIVKRVMHYLRRTKGYIHHQWKFKGLETLTPILQDVKIENAPHLDTSTCWLKELSLGNLLNRLL
ncbi:hypothetical protein CR513_46266, partial [Mucuna pruriens]